MDSYTGDEFLEKLNRALALAAGRMIWADRVDLVVVGDCSLYDDGDPVPAFGGIVVPSRSARILVVCRCCGQYTETDRARIRACFQVEFPNSLELVFPQQKHDLLNESPVDPSSPARAQSLADDLIAAGLLVLER